MAERGMMSDPIIGDWKVGDEVWVNGEGSGVIEKIDDRDVNPYAVVAIPRSELHEKSGKTIKWTQRVSVSISVYPTHMEKRRS